MKKNLLVTGFWLLVILAIPSFAQAPTVTACTPESYAQGCYAWLWVSGSNFLPGVIVTVEGGGIGHNYEFITPESSLISGFHIYIDTNATPGPRNVRVTNPDGSYGIGYNLFEVLTGEVATYYVRTNGSDSSNNGKSESSPFKTITKASRVAVPGSTIEVGAGTFSAGEVFPIQLQQNVTLHGAGGVSKLSGGTYTLIDATGQPIPSPRSGFIISLMSSWGGTIESLAITGIPSDGCGLSSHGNNPAFHIRDCLFYGDGSGQNTDGVGLGGLTNSRISNIIAYGLSDSGLNFGGSSSNTVVENATITNCNNGINASSNSEIWVKNSIIANNGNGLIKFGSATLHSDYNDVYGNTSNYSNVSAGAKDISRNPALNANFSLKDTSPCIKAGENGVDMGAIPFTGTRRKIIYVDDNRVEFPNADFTTISTACATAISGDTIIVATGEYKSSQGESFPVTVPAGVLLQGSGGIGADGTATGKTVIVGTYGQPASSEVVRLSNNSTLEGVMIKGVGPSNNDFGIAVGANGDTIKADIRKCFLDGEGNGWIGIFLSGQRGGGGEAGVNNTKISNCVVTGFNGGIHLLTINQPASVSAEVNQVTVARNKGVIGADGQNTKVTVKNSIIATNEGDGLNGFNGGVIESNYCNVYDNRNNYAGSVTSTNNITVEPYFIDPATKNFRLQSTAEVEGSFTHSNNTSPCIDAGDPSSDYSGEVRGDYFNGNRANLGAFGNTYWFEPTPTGEATPTTTTTTSTTTTTTTGEATSTTTTTTSTATTTTTTVAAPPAVSITPPQTPGQAANLNLEFQSPASGELILIVSDPGPPPKVLLEKRVELKGEKKFSAELAYGYGAGNLPSGHVYEYKVLDAATKQQLASGRIAIP